MYSCLLRFLSHGVSFVCLWGEIRFRSRYVEGMTVMFSFFKKKKRSQNGGSKSFQVRYEKSQGGLFTGKTEPKHTFNLMKVQTSIGRNSSNDIIMRDSSVSGQHGTIIKGESSCIFKDHSKNGTFLLRTNEDERQIKDEMVEIYPGDVLEFGRSQDRIFRLYFEQAS